MHLNQEIKPIILEEDFIRYIKQCNDDFSRKNTGLHFSWDEIVNFFFALFTKKEPAEKIVSDLDVYRDDIIRQMSSRDRESVIKQWIKYGIDQATAEYYMDYFALKDDSGNRFDFIIPDDPATIFVWYYYEVYCWEEIGNDFGIYIYIWLYGFFFPDRIFEIPSREDISDEVYEYLYNNNEKFEREMTMGIVVKLILLYKCQINRDNIFFESDIPTRPIECNTGWRAKLIEFKRMTKCETAPE